MDLALNKVPVNGFRLALTACRGYVAIPLKTKWAADGDGVSEFGVTRHCQGCGRPEGSQIPNNRPHAEPSQWA
jgi:hypothetical protein